MTGLATKMRDIHNPVKADLRMLKCARKVLGTCVLGNASATKLGCGLERKKSKFELRLFLQHLRHGKGTSISLTLVKRQPDHEHLHRQR